MNDRHARSVDLAIVRVLEGGAVEGLTNLANLIHYDPCYVHRRLGLLRQSGVLEIEYPPASGRGHKVRISKRNRNSPGYPRKR